MLKDINDPAVEEEMERELNTIAKLDHENIVRIYGVFSVADTGNTGKLTDHLGGKEAWRTMGQDCPRCKETPSHSECYQL